MGRKRRSQDLAVSMNGHRVGTFSQSSNGNVAFSYHQAWLSSEHGRPISLSLPLTNQRYIGEVVYNFFDNLLPDNSTIRTRIQKRFGAPTNHCFDLLSYTGRDCVGALQLSPEEELSNAKTLNADRLTEKEIATTLRSYATAPLGMREDIDFRISIAGAQEKTAFLLKDGAWHRPYGATPTSHIFKLPIGQIEPFGIDLSESVENEWLCLTILKQFGLPVPDTSIQIFDGVKALVVERFDRKWAPDNSWLMRLPQEDMCQALKISPALKYESDGGPGIKNIMALLLGSTDNARDRLLFLKAQFVYWLLAAIDGHAKNFSIFLLPKGRFKMTPFYDVLSAYPMIENKQLELRKIKMAMAVIGKNRHYHWHEITRQNWLNTAKLCRFSTEEMTQTIEETLGELDDIIERTKAIIPPNFPSKISDSRYFVAYKRPKAKLGHPTLSINSTVTQIE